MSTRKQIIFFALGIILELTSSVSGDEKTLLQNSTGKYIGSYQNITPNKNSDSLTITIKEVFLKENTAKITFNITVNAYARMHHNRDVDIGATLTLMNDKNGEYLALNFNYGNVMFLTGTIRDSAMTGNITSIAGSGTLKAESTFSLTKNP